MLTRTRAVTSSEYTATIECERDPLMLENCFELDDIDLIRLSMTEAPSFWENVGFVILLPDESGKSRWARKI